MARKIAICFFGITRSLTHTIESIEAKILAPARRVADPVILSHFFTQKQIDNPRSGEKGTIRPDEHRLLNNDWVSLEEPNTCLETWDFAGLKSFGDAWDDDFRSLRNLLHQLHSLNAVTQKALESGVGICIFCRPDLRYHDSFSKLLNRALNTEHDAVYLPDWQAWEGGLNDRFAICVGQRAIAAYGQRITDARAFCEDGNRPLHAERLLEYALASRNIPVEKIGLRASRIRIDGSHPAVDTFRHPLWKLASSMSGKLGIKPVLRKIFRIRRP